MEACAALGGASLDPTRTVTLLTRQVVVDNVMTATWDLGEAQCRARILCRPPPCQPTQSQCLDCVEWGVCQPCDGGSCTPDETTVVARRTVGFYQPHPH